MVKKTTLLALTGTLILFSGLFAYATLGEGRRKSAKRKAQLSLSARVEATPGTFSLKSGYEFRGVTFSQEQKNQLQVNSVVSMQIGNHVYTMPLKKRIWTQKVNVSFGNQSLRRH